MNTDLVGGVLGVIIVLAIVGFIGFALYLRHKEEMEQMRLDYKFRLKMGLDDHKEEDEL